VSEDHATYSCSALQTSPAFGAVTANLDAVEALIEGLRSDLLVLPELFASGYSFVDRDELVSLAEPFDGGETTERLKRWSRSTGGAIVAGFPERDGDAVYNAAAVVANGELIDCYRKIHLFGFERGLYEPGDRPFAVHECGGLRVGTMICFDWMYPEAARTLALRGADVIAHPSNLVLPGWCQQAMLIRALENRVYTVTANRFGTERRPPRPELQFTGTSRIANPRGEVVADAPALGDTLLHASIETVLARDKQVPSGNDVLAERRPAFYAE
jgi:predicted amidohydrolase